MVDGWRIILAPRAEKALKRMPADEMRRWLSAIDRLAQDPASARVKALKGRPEWSLRVGGRRALLRIDREARAIVIVAIGSRGDVYKD
ncbi:MAG TPA: type II toxin-antitoxin system RelE/ParE family toxin [Limnochordia bacterium]